MPQLEILNSKKVKDIASQIEEYYGANLSDDFAWLQNKEGKIFIISKKLGEIETKKICINNLGLYFCKLEHDGIRLSIEGSQILKPKKHVLVLNEEEIKKWMKGEDIEIKEDCEGFVAVKHGDDFYGCGRVKNKKLLNFVPKGRRIIAL